MTLLIVLLEVAVIPPGEEVTLYEVIVRPPSEEGGVKATFAESTPTRETAPIVGGPATVGVATARTGRTSRTTLFASAELYHQPPLTPKRLK